MTIFVVCRRLVCLALLAFSAVHAGEWKAGVGREVITPEEPMRMSGYAGRDTPAKEKLHDLWVKALAVEDPAGTRLVLLTMDLVGIDKATADKIVHAIGTEHKLPREAISIATSHTHSGPLIGTMLRPTYVLNEKEDKIRADYTESVCKRAGAAATAALKGLTPARLSWTIGKATFAVNRRENPEKDVPDLMTAGKIKGPFDHDVPVLRVASADDKLLAIVCGYACHCTTLNGLQWSGDYAGYAQIEIEKSNPGATALFFAGCGADQNPLPRRSVELAQKYGSQLAESVAAALKQELKPISGAAAARFTLLDLPYAKLPTQEDLDKELQHRSPYLRKRAELLSAEIKEKGALSPAYPYPVQVWQLGPELTWVLLGGEVVVDYSLRLKKELGERTWLAAYCNDVMSYIPSARVLKEGGYEGRESMTYFGLPSAWGNTIEELIVAKVHALVKEAKAGVAK